MAKFCSMYGNKDHEGVGSIAQNIASKTQPHLLPDDSLSMMIWLGRAIAFKATLMYIYLWI